jgi:aspartate aminotransferase
MGSVQQSASIFEKATFIPPDAIFEVTKNFLADTNPKKVNVGAGTYRDENGKPWVLPSVRMAKELVKDCGHEYLPISGLKSFRDKAVEMVFHDSKALKEGRVSTNICSSTAKY